jgi:hypothetical protein
MIEQTALWTGRVLQRSIPFSSDVRFYITYFDDRLEAQSGNHPVSRIPAAIRSSAALLSIKPLTPSAAVCILRLAILPAAPAESSQSTEFAKHNEICKTIKIPREGHEEDKCAV